MYDMNRMRAKACLCGSSCTWNTCEASERVAYATSGHDEAKERMKRLSYKERRADALALRADEGRDKLR